MNEKLEMITVSCADGYKFPLMVNKLTALCYIPIDFLKEVLNKKFKDLLDAKALVLSSFTIDYLIKIKTSKKIERDSLVKGLNAVLSLIGVLGFDKALEGLKKPKLLEAKIIGETRFANKDILSNINLEDIKRNAVKVKWKITGGGGRNGNPSDKRSATGSGKTQPLSKSIYNSSVYPTLPPLNVDPIIQMKESEVYELHKKVMDFEKLKAENERLMSINNDLREENMTDEDIFNDKNQEIEVLNAKLEEILQKIELKDKTIARLVNSVNRTAKELDLTKSIYKDIIKSLVKG